MNSNTFEELSVGAVVASCKYPPITRRTLALYAGASGDHNGLHIDSDLAKAAGMPDVFAHGMLSAAFLAKVLTDRFGPNQLRDLSLRFVRIMPVHGEPDCSATVIEKFVQNGEERISLNLSCVDAASPNREEKITGTAVIALPK